MQSNSQPPSFYNLFSSRNQPNPKPQPRKTSTKLPQPAQQPNPILRQSPQPLQPKLKQTQSTNLITKKKPPAITTEPSIKDNIIIAQSQQQAILQQQKLQENERRDYLALKVTPVLNRMLVKIVNHKPQNMLKFMIDFLRKEEHVFEDKRFNDQALNNAISQSKMHEDIFDNTVATQFLKFKK